MWSWESTDMPMTWPRIHLFGKGLGQNGSTSNMGACTEAASTVALFLSVADPIASATISARKVAPINRLRFMALHSPLGGSEVPIRRTYLYPVSGQMQAFPSERS